MANLKERIKKLKKEMVGKEYSIFELDDILVNEFWKWKEWENKPSILDNISEKEVIDNGSISLEVDDDWNVNVEFDVLDEIIECYGIETPLLRVTDVELI